MHVVQSSSRWTALLAGMLVASVGMGLSNPAIAATALGVVSSRRTDMAWGIRNPCRLGGIVCGSRHSTRSSPAASPASCTRRWATPGSPSAASPMRSPPGGRRPPLCSAPRPIARTRSLRPGPPSGRLRRDAARRRDQRVGAHPRPRLPARDRGHWRHRDPRWWPGEAVNTLIGQRARPHEPGSKACKTLRPAH